MVDYVDTQKEALRTQAFWLLGNVAGHVLPSHVKDRSTPVPARWQGRAASAPHGAPAVNNIHRNFLSHGFKKPKAPK
jgi:hypothetical protein